MAACLYSGRVEHTRFGPRRHRFGYRMTMLFLELTPLDRDLLPYRWLMASRLSPFRIRPEDHMPSRRGNLDAAVRGLIERRAGIRPTGPIRLLTGFGFMLWRFNPLSLYYCYDRDDANLEWVVAEVTNTPWRERFCYVLDMRGQVAGKPQILQHEKRFHVSPFMPMDTRYHWRLTTPGQDLGVTIAITREDQPLFSAGLELRRRSLSRRALLATFLSMPFTTLKVVAAIYWQALRLWLKGAPFHAHPGDTSSTAAEKTP